METERCTKKLKTNTTCNDIVGHLHLPSDLLSQILTTLPIKSLCRFKCVSKYIKSLIENPVFVNNIRPRDSKFDWELFVGDKINICSIDENGSVLNPMECIEFDGIFWNIRFCNGLIMYHINNFLTLFNLSTQDSIDIAVEFEYFDFGFDPLSKKYKVLGWNQDEESNYCISDFHVITLEKNCLWRPLTTNTTPQVIRHLYQSDVTVDGTLFWLRHLEEERCIISFNLATEKFGISKLPSMMSNDAEDKDDLMCTLFEFEGCLCLVQQPKCERPPRCHLEIVNLWMLKDIHNNVWVSIMKNTILPMEGTYLREHFLGLLPEPEDTKEAQFAGRNGEIMIMASDSNNVYIFLYCLLSGKFRRIKVTAASFAEVTWRPHVKNNLDFQELVSHNHITLDATMNVIYGTILVREDLLRNCICSVTKITLL